MTVDKDQASSAEAAAAQKAGFDQGAHRGKLAAAVVKMAGEAAETDTESGGSSTEEGESPRSVTMWRRRRRRNSAAVAACLHNQVLRVMEEDLHLWEDTAFNGVESGGSHADRQTVIPSRPLILRCSPLSGMASASMTVQQRRK